MLNIFNNAKDNNLFKLKLKYNSGIIQNEFVKRILMFHIIYMPQTYVSYEMCTALNVSKKIREQIYFGCLIHDFGKLFIDNDILFKNGDLTTEEFNQIKQHPALGYEVLKDYISIIPRDIILYHHEKIDGTGYNKVNNNYLPLHVRIAILCDVYEALRSERPYKKGHSHYKAMKILKMMKVDKELLYYIDLIGKDVKTWKIML